MIVSVLKYYLFETEKAYTLFYEKLGSGHSTKSSLISYEILSILVLKVSELVSYSLNAELSNVVASTAPDVFLDI